jgi:subtilisin family serine protease
MKGLIVIGLIFLSISLFGQNNSYYWYKGEKVPLQIVKQKKFILFKKESESKVISDFARNSWNVIKKKEVNFFNTLIPYKGNSESDTNEWAVIVSESNQISDSIALRLSPKVLYASTFFSTKSGEEAGLSNLFYVRLYKAEDIDKLEYLASKNNVEILGKDKFMPAWYTLSCTRYSKGNALEMANSFYESGIFKSAEPDLMPMNLFNSVNDTYFSDQWNLNNTGQYGGSYGVDINICEAWETTSGSENIVIAFVDQGIEMDHPDLPEIFTLSYDAETGTTPSVVRGAHGTACAGIAGAAKDNEEGIAGIAPGCQLMSVSHSMMLGTNTRQQLAGGINWAWHNGADIISNSWGSNALIGAYIDEAIDSALTFGRGGLGCVIVFASGNNNNDIIYPGDSNPDIITVGAMSPCGERKSPTSCDTEDIWGSNYGNELDLVAPGVLIPTTDLQGVGEFNSYLRLHPLCGGDKITTDYSNPDYTVWFNGTSAATPHVAGVAALILSINPGLTQEEVRNIIESTCTKVGSYNYSTVAGRNNGTWHQEVGYGLVNAHAAVLAAYPYISGPSLVCPSSNSPFTVNHSPSEATITWQCETSLLERVSVQGSNPCDFVATGSGNAWVQAVINTVEGDYTVPKVNCSAGIPTIMYLGGPTYIEEDHGDTYYAVKDTWNFDAQYYWYLSPSGYVSSPTNENGTYVTFGSPDTYTLEVAACNSCGCSDNYYLEIEVYGNYRLMLSPNPSTSQTIVSLQSTSGEIKDSDPEWYLEVYNQGLQQKIFAKNIKGIEFNLNTSNWSDGLYIIHARYQGKWLTGKLVVGKN